MYFLRRLDGSIARLFLFVGVSLFARRFLFSCPHVIDTEYSPDFPHARGTVGYAGRPSGPAWYVSILDNRNNHGPGSQQARNPHEADACFGTVVEGLEEVVVARVHAMPGMGFLKQEMHVKITKMTILVLDEKDEYVEWQPSSPS